MLENLNTNSSSSQAMATAETVDLSKSTVHIFSKVNDGTGEAEAVVIKDLLEDGCSFSTIVNYCERNFGVDKEKLPFLPKVNDVFFQRIENYIKTGQPEKFRNLCDDILDSCNITDGIITYREFLQHIFTPEQIASLDRLAEKAIYKCFKAEHLDAFYDFAETFEIDIKPVLDILRSAR